MAADTNIASSEVRDASRAVDDHLHPDDVRVRWLAPNEQRAWRAIVDGAHGLLAALDTALIADAGLSFDEYRVLVLLSENDRLRMSDLSAGSLASRSTVSRCTSRLIDDGLVQRAPDADDRRTRWVQITKAGLDRLHAAAYDHVRLVRHLLVDHITPAQLDTLADVFTGVESRTDLTRPPTTA